MTDLGENVALFTYGTLQIAAVQLDTFGRLLDGEDDVLPGFTVDYTDIGDDRVAAVSGHSVHPILCETGNHLDKVVGRVLHITEAELEAADEYEVSEYRRIEVVLASGATAWVFVAR